MSSLYTDESERIRIDEDEDRAAFARRTRPPVGGALAIVGKTVNGNPNDIQRIALLSDLGGSPTGGTFTLSKTNSSGVPIATTGPISWSASGATLASAVQSALVTLYGAGTVTVNGAAWPNYLTATFGGSLANTPVNTMAGNGSALTGPDTDYHVSATHQAFGEPTYPSTAKSYYRIEKCKVTGTESNGSAVTITGLGVYIYAYNVGTSIPPLDTKLLVRRPSDGWAFRYSAC